MAAIVRAMPRATVVEATDTYLHAEFRSAVFRFVDDVDGGCRRIRCGRL